MNDLNQFDDLQSRLKAWHEWNNQSSEYRIAHPEPLKPQIAPTPRQRVLATDQSMV